MRQLLADRHRAAFAGALQDDPDPGLPLESAAMRVDSEHAHRAGRATPVALEDLDGGRLARAVRAEQRERLTDADVEGDPLDGGLAAVALDEFFDVDGGGVHVS